MAAAATTTTTESINLTRIDIFTGLLRERVFGIDARAPLRGLVEVARKIPRIIAAVRYIFQDNSWV